MRPVKSGEHKKKILYYIDEVLIFIITVVAIVFSDILEGTVRGHGLAHWHFVMSWKKIIAASFIAIMIYGSLNGSFRYTDKDKPPFFKRAYQALLNGVAWKSIVGFTGIQ